MTGLDGIDALLFMGACAFIVGWGFTLGVVFACKFQKWSPVNVVNQLNDFRDSTAEYKLKVLGEEVARRKEGAA